MTAAFRLGIIKLIHCQISDSKTNMCTNCFLFVFVICLLQPLTLDGIVDLLDEQLQFHDQCSCMCVRLPRRVLLHHLKGAVHPVFNIKIIIQEFGEIHLA